MLKNLSSLNKLELKSFLDSFDTVLCDYDGVVVHADSPFPGVKETLKLLKVLGKEIGLVTNNSSRGPEGFQKILDELEYEVDIDRVIFPTLTMIDYLKKIKFNKEIFCLGFPGMRQEFSKAGFKVAYNGPNEIQEYLPELLNHYKDNENVGAVIIDIDLNINYVRLLRALAYLQRPEVLFFIGATDKKLVLGPNLILIGPHYFRIMLEGFSGRKAMEFGKPSKCFNDFIVKKFDIKDPARVLFVGDALEQDMGFASKFGYQGLLALSGATSLEEAKSYCNQDIIPEFYINSLGDLHEMINAVNK